MMILLVKKNVLCSSKNSDGNKTESVPTEACDMLCSSKNSDGNKTINLTGFMVGWLCSSKNSDGNKTSNKYYHNLSIFKY